MRHGIISSLKQSFGISSKRKLRAAGRNRKRSLLCEQLEGRRLLAVVYTDDFNRAALNTGGPLTYTTTATGGGSASIVSSTTLQLANGTPAGRVSVTATPTVANGWNQTLDNTTGVVTWTFNTRFGRTGNTPSGFTAGNYSNAFVLDSDTNDFSAAAAKGYAILYGNTGSPDTFRLVAFNAGITADYTTVGTTAGSALIVGSGAFSTSTQALANDYYSFKVTYDSTSHVWSWYGRDDGATAFADPATVPTTTAIGTFTETTPIYRGTALGKLGALWNHSTAAGNNSQFDNFTLDVTSTATPPVIGTPTSASITQTTATLGGNVSSDGGATITGRGVVYSLTSANNDPIIGGTGVTQVTASGTTGAFTSNVTSLTAGSGYSFKAYATNSAGTTYTTVSTFSTSAATAPVVTAPTASNIGPTTATLGATVGSDGGSGITERGFVYSSTNADPIIGGSGVTKQIVSGTTGPFTASLSGLNSSTSYSYKAYAINNVGTTYTTPTSTFSTIAALAAPTVSSPTAAAIGTTTVTLGGTVVSDGGDPITERGVVYSLTSANGSPIIGGSGVTKVTVSGTTGTFTTNITGLTSGSGYSYSAYAINSTGTTYTTPVATFTTVALFAPTVSTPTATGIGATTATLGGTVSSDGGATITERGIVYSLTSANADPTISGSGVTKVLVSGTTGTFTTPVTGLTSGAGYSYKAYAINSVGTTYTSPVSAFTTNSVPVVAVPSAPTVTDIIAILSGNVTSDGGATVTGRGFVYSVQATNSNPQISGTGVTNSTSTGTTGAYTKSINGLSPNTTYAYASYAVNAVGTTYSTVGTFTTTATIALAPGDIAFTGYNGTTTPERISFVALKDITSGTSILFTDNGWDGNLTTPAFTTGEANYSLSFTQAFAAGSRFYYDSVTTAFQNFDGTSTGLLSAVTGNTGFNNSGDQFTAIQGTLTSPTSFIAEISSNSFVTSGALPSSTQTTYLAPGLVVGDTAITLGTGTFNGVLDSTKAAIGSNVTGTASAIRNLIENISNWSASASTTLVVPPAITFTVTTIVTPTITATPLTKIYDGSAFSIAGTADDGPGGAAADTSGFTYTYYAGSNLTGGTIAAPTNVGSYSVDLAYAGNANYSPVASTAFNFTITAAPLTVTASDASKTYGQLFSGTAFTSSGLVNSETIGSVTLSSTGAAATAGVAGSPYPIVPSAATGGTFSAANYNIAYVNGSLTVNTAPLTITADAKSKVYGSPDPALTYATSGLVNGDAASGSLSRVTGENVGTYAITQGSVTAGANYSVTYVGANLSITPKALTVTADAKTKAAGSSDPALTFTTSGLTNGDTAGTALSGSLTRAAGEAPGTYAITQGTLAAVAGNYDITYLGANFTITVSINSVAVNGADTYLKASQRSQITSLVVTLSAQVTNPATAFTITNVGLYANSPETTNNTVLSSGQILVTNVGNVYTIRFGAGTSVDARQGSGVKGNSLADGNYRLNVAFGTNAFGAVAADNFFRMFGDSDGDGDVDGTDTLAFRAAQSTYNAALDWEGDGAVSGTGVDSQKKTANSGKIRRLF